MHAATDTKKSKASTKEATEPKAHVRKGRPMLARPSGPGSAMANFLMENLPADRTYQELAEEMGYGRANIISMWKSRGTKVTLDNVKGLADLCGVDLGYMLALYIDQYVSDWSGVNEFPAIVETLTRLTTPDEWEIIKTVREARRHNSMPITAAQRDGLKKLFEVPITTSEGPYKPVVTVEDLRNVPPDEASRRKFARRGHARDMSIDEIEEHKGRVEATSTELEKGAVRKKPAKKSAE